MDLCEFCGEESYDIDLDACFVCCCNSDGELITDPPLDFNSNDVEIYEVDPAVLFER